MANEDNNSQDSSIQAEIDAHNALREQELNAPDADDADESGDIQTGDDANAGDDNAAGENGDDATDDQSGNGTNAADEEFKFTENADWETFEAEEAAYLETLEIPAELQIVIDRYRTELSAQREQVGQLTDFGGVDNVTKIMTALNRTFETEIVGGEPVANAKPLVEVLRTDYKNEFPSIALEMFASPSAKYQGLSLNEELLVDSFRREGETFEQAFNRVNTAIGYLGASGVSLPDIPTPTPKGVDARVADAWRDLPENKRFEIESLIDEIAEKTRELAEEDNAYQKGLIQEEINQKQALLNAENKVLQRIQFGIDSERQQAVNQQQTQAAEALAFQNTVVETFNNEIYSLSETFARDISQNLTFLDENMRLPMARNIEARIVNALETDAQGAATPNALYFEKQLKEEGVKYDFSTGREKIQQLFAATEKLALLEHKKASPMAIEQARRARNAVLADIKAEKKTLIGQIGTRFINSAGEALEKKVESAKQKKQIVRKVANESGAGAKQKQTLNDIDRERREYNARIERQIQEGDLDGLQTSFTK